MANEMMDWQRLVSDKRFGLEDVHVSGRGARSDFRRDYDRLVFSSPFRRLQNKTQVFPLPGSIFVHNRLTHSLEVASVGRSMAAEVVERMDRGTDASLSQPLRSLPDIVAAACLAHDLGNPPFGHSGEKAIASYFSEGAGQTLESQFTPEQWADLTHFEGNANAFRLLTNRFRGRRPGGFAMTYSTLASIVKYPYQSTLANQEGKFGFFTSERDSFIRVADELGMLRLPAPDGAVRYARHPLVYVVEAADDICYEIMDIEDAHKLKLLPTRQVLDLFLGYFDGNDRDHKLEIMEMVEDPNEKISYLRSSIIGRLVDCCAQVFVDNHDQIMRGEFNGTLVDNLPELERGAYQACAALSWDKIYVAPDVVDIELAGTSIISFLVDKLVHAVINPHLNYSKLLLAKVPVQYQVDAPDLYGKVQAAVDHVSGMTDVYALDMYRKLNGMSLKINN